MRRRIVLNTLVISIITVGALLINGCGKVETATVLANAETVYSEASETEESSEKVEESSEQIEESSEQVEETETTIEATATEPIVEETETSSEDESDITPLNQTMYSKGNVNIRSGPSTDYTKTGSLTTNQQVQVTGQSKSSGWYEIMISGQKSYVSNKYLSLEKVVVETPKPSNNTGAQGNGGASESGGQQTTPAPQPSTGGAGSDDAAFGSSIGKPGGFAGMRNDGTEWDPSLGSDTPMQ